MKNKVLFMGLFVFGIFLARYSFAEEVTKKDIAKEVDRIIQEPKSPRDRFTIEYLIEEPRKMGTPAIELLITRLEDKNVTIRRDAAFALGRIGIPALEPLIAVLNDKRKVSYVRQEAVHGLGKMGAPGVPSLLAVLNDRDEDSEVRWLVAGVLREAGYYQTGASLIAIAKDETEIPKIRQEALRSLGFQLAPPYNRPTGVPDDKISELRDIFLAALNSQDAGMRRVAIEAQARIGDPRAFELLIAALKDKDKVVQWRAAEALGEIKDDRAVQPLIALLLQKIDPNIERRSKMASRLLDSAYQQAQGPVQLSQSQSTRVIQAQQAYSELVAPISAAAEALGEIGDPRAIEPLFAVLEDEHILNVPRSWLKDGASQDKASWALGRIGGSQVLDRLVAILKDTDDYRDARIVVNERGSRITYLSQRAQKQRKRRAWAVEVLGEMQDPRVVEHLIAAFEDNEINVRRNAVKALRKKREPRAAEALIARLADPDDGSAYTVRKLARQALLELKSDHIVELLIAASKKEDVVLQREAIELLSELKDPRAVEPLIAKLSDKDSHIRESAAEALGKIGDHRAVEPLIDVLKDKNVFVRLKAIKALGEIKDARSIEPLTAALQDKDQRIREKAAQALTEIKKIGN